MGPLSVEEIEFEVKFGTIAAKWWGSQQKRPILMVHGWQDSAGSFDTLIPLLSTEFSYLAIDLPGHGFSSHIPSESYYHAIDYVPLLEQIRIKFKWDRLSLVAHSMGAIVSFFYASVFPDNVDLVVSLDTLKMQNLRPHITQKIYLWRTRRVVELDENLTEESPEYTYDEMVRRVFEGSLRSVDMDKADYMIKRGSRPSQNAPGRFYFTRDIRVKYMQPFYTEQKIGLDYIKGIKCAYLFIRSEDTIFAEPEQNIREAVDQFRRYNKHFEMLKVKGTHHAHLNGPEQMAGKIGSFLIKYYQSEAQKPDGIWIKAKL